METKKIELNTVLFSAISIILIDFALIKLSAFTALRPYAITAIARLVEIIVILLIIVKFNNGTSSIGISKSTAVFGIKKGLFWSFGFGLLTALVFLIIAVSGTNPFHLLRTRLPLTRIDIIFYYIAGGLIAPVAEEIFFRGILFGFLRKWGFVFAAIVSTAIFVVIHPLGSSIPVPQIVGGLFFALSYEIEKSLFVPIIIHASGNIAIFTISLL